MCLPQDHNNGRIESAALTLQYTQCSITIRHVNQQLKSAFFTGLEPASAAVYPSGGNANQLGTDDEVTVLYPHEMLRAGQRWPSDVNPIRRERHLADDAFVAAIGVAKEGFYQLPEWRQLTLKRDCGLF